MTDAPINLGLDGRVVLVTGGVRGVQRRGDLADDPDRPFRRHRTVAGEYTREVGAVDQPHVDVEPAVDLAVGVNGNDVRIVQPPGGVGLPVHPLPERGVTGVRPGDQLERDRPVLVDVVRGVHLAKPAPAQQPEQPVRAELFGHRHRVHHGYFAANFTTEAPDA